MAAEIGVTLFKCSAPDDLVALLEADEDFDVSMSEKKTKLTGRIADTVFLWVPAPSRLTSEHCLKLCQSLQKEPERNAHGAEHDPKHARFSLQQSDKPAKERKQERQAVAQTAQQEVAAFERVQEIFVVQHGISVFPVRSLEHLAAAIRQMALTRARKSFLTQRSPRKTPVRERPPLDMLPEDKARVALARALGLPARNESLLESLSLAQLLNEDEQTLRSHGISASASRQIYRNARGADFER
ncbi:MAG: hypothetical protein MHM6MM_002330 [Cercozoa sp. M6MM]